MAFMPWDIYEALDLLRRGLKALLRRHD